MKGSSYRLKSPTLGILSTDNGENRLPFTIPLHAVITAGETLEGNIFTEVMWEGKKILIFTEDLLARGEPMSEKAV
jgi:hypothetical protein